MPRGLKKRAVSDEQINKKPPARKKFKKLGEDKSTPQKHKSKNDENIVKASPKKKREKLTETVKKSKTEKVKVDQTNAIINTEHKSLPVDDINNLNIGQLLALGESCKSENVFEDRFSSHSIDTTDSEQSDFEEVKEGDQSEPIIPKEGVSIFLDVPNLHRSKRNKSNSETIEAAIKRQVNRVKKGIQLLMHKVHLLCWIAHIKFVNNTLNSPSLLVVSKSLIKSKNLYPPKYADLSYLEGILKWFHKNFELEKENNLELVPEESKGLLNELMHQFKNKKANSCKIFILMFITLLRILGLKTRIIMSFQVVPVKPAFSELYDIESIKIRSKQKKMEAASSNGGTGEGSKTALKSEKIESSESQPQPPRDAKNKSKEKKKSVSDGGKNEKNKKKKTCLRSSSKNTKASETEFQSDSEQDSESEHFKSVNSKKNKNKITLKEPNKNLRKEIREEMNKKLKMKNKKDDCAIEIMSDLSDGSDSDFNAASLEKKASRKKKSGKMSPSSNVKESPNKKEGSDIWTEVFLEDEERWISVNVPKQKIHCINELYSKATHPVAYVIACNNDGSLKDVTKRYVPNYHSDTRKKRVDDEWWDETLKPYLPSQTAQEKEEDEDISRQLSDKPLPATISEFKNHPLYVLKRHLLKFEALYPPDAPTLGFVRGEPVYARECVAVLHSREMWYKQARLVRLKEEPYKIVKARPKFDKMTGEIKKDLPLELFGRWQTEDYIPPIATDGKVPRNEYGNVDLFQPCMLPVGTVHLQLPNLNKVARKLGIDCAPATVGFDFHSGASHPVFDGFVVCEEFKEILLDSWSKEADEAAKKSEEKKEKRVYGNWKRLIRGLLIREKLKLKYAFGENDLNVSTPTDLQEKEETE